MQIEHRTTSQLEAGLEELRNSPKDNGVLQLIVRRPAAGQREVLETGELSMAEGLVGDSWKLRESSHTPDGSAHPDYQINIMNSRSAALVAQHSDRWPIAGDQLYVDLNLGGENLPVGTRLAIGSSVLEVTSPPHTGCAKFMARFGRDATLFVNSREGRELNLRGINARVVKSGTIRVGDLVTKIPNDGFIPSS
jgi:hypothetical protein